MNIFFVSLGCDKNLVDSEMMITSLRKDGFTITDRDCGKHLLFHW